MGYGLPYGKGRSRVGGVVMGLRIGSEIRVRDLALKAGVSPSLATACLKRCGFPIERVARGLYRRVASNGRGE